MDVHIVCQGLRQDYILQRMSRTLADGTGWTLSEQPRQGAEWNVYIPYLTYLNTPRPATKTAAYFSHREDTVPAKAAMWYDAMDHIDVALVTADVYANECRPHLHTAKVRPFVDLDHFTLDRASTTRRGVGVSGYLHIGQKHKRKGVDVLQKAVQRTPDIAWQASGKGWPIPTQDRPWAQMPAWYGGLQAYVVTSTIEGIPVPPLEALAMGTPVIVPAGVGCMDDIIGQPGVYGYDAGDAAALVQALEACLSTSHAPGELRRVIEDRYTPDDWRQTVAMGLETYHAPRWVSEPQSGTWGCAVIGYGEVARREAASAIRSFKTHHPDTDVMFIGAAPLGCEDLFHFVPQRDPGGRWAKTHLYELVPESWEYTLYIDADTQFIGNVEAAFIDPLRAGWEFVASNMLHTFSTSKEAIRKVSRDEYQALESELCTLDGLQAWGGGLAFRRCEATKAMFTAWAARWGAWGMRDQAHLTGALVIDAPLRVWWLGPEWHVIKDKQDESAAGIIHYPGQARGFDDLSPEAWR